MSAKKTIETNRLIQIPQKAFESPYPERVLAIAPSILSADFANLARDLRKMMAARCYWAHVDVMDGHFVPNITFGPVMVKSVRSVSPKVFIDAHLMIEDPLKFVEPFAEAGADSITIHAEAVDNLPRAIATMKRLGIRVGVSVRPRTSIKAMESVLDKIDIILIMTVEPGFGGQEMLPNTINKVRQLASRREKEGFKYLIQVDGGVNDKTVGLPVAAGANVLVAGTAVFKGGDVKTNIAKLVEGSSKVL